MTAPPREPTQEMVNAGREELTGPRADDKAPMRRAWIAMYDAAPAPSAECCRGLAPISECRKECGGNAPPAAQPAEPSATDDLVARLHDVLRNWTNVTDDEQAVIRDSAAKLQRQAREIAELKSERNAAQRAGVTTANYWMERAEMAEDQRERTRDVWATRAERAEAELHKANIDSANLLAECSDMSVDVEKYRQEIAALRLAVKDDAQWAQENERLTRELDRVKVQLTSEITAALAERDAAIGSVNVLKTKYGECVDERDALRECLAELVACADESDSLAYERLYGKPHMPEYKARELDHRQRKIEAWRAARAKVKP